MPPWSRSVCMRAIPAIPLFGIDIAKSRCLNGFVWSNGGEMITIRRAVFPAAGLGTRFLPATKAQPKEMLALVDKPQIQYVAEECVASGIEHIIIVTGK